LEATDPGAGLQAPQGSSDPGGLFRQGHWSGAHDLIMTDHGPAHRHDREDFSFGEDFSRE
jgi:hypothetical protein